MANDNKLMMRALRGETLPVPPVWMMRQAGRYLPEYRATREKAGSFLQPIRRYGFDAAILFADILLVPQALGLDLWFVEGEGPRLSTVGSAADLAALKPVEAIHDTLAPVYETVRILRAELPAETTLIGFAGAPWTVATYMIAGRSSRDQEPARRMMYGDPATFDGLIDRVTEATAAYLIRQIEAGAEVVKLFDSWAGALPGLEFQRYCVEPARRIVAAVRAAHPEVPIIGFPRECCALDTSVDPAWAAATVQRRCCVQGNLDPLLLVTGGEALVRATRRTVAGFAGGPHVFNLGHGITPDADPANVDVMLKAIRG